MTKTPLFCLHIWFNFWTLFVVCWTIKKQIITCTSSLSNISWLLFVAWLLYGKTFQITKQFWFFIRQVFFCNSLNLYNCLIHVLVQTTKLLDPLLSRTKKQRKMIISSSTFGETLLFTIINQTNCLELSI